MKIGNRKELDAAREAMRDAFDAVWIAADEIGQKEARAIRCAIALNGKPSPNWNERIFQGGKLFPSGDIVRRGRECYPVIYA